jgi:hypothetical protein
MATTVGSFSAIDDTEVDAESPITETLMTRMRDNSYWIDAGTRQTTQTSTTKVLAPDGSGGVAWVEVDTLVSGIDGSKGLATTFTSVSWTTLTTATSGILSLRYHSGSSDSEAFMDLSDETFVTSGYNGTTTYNVSSDATSDTTVLILENNIGGDAYINFRRDSGNLQYKLAAGSPESGGALLWCIF